MIYNKIYEFSNLYPIETGFDNIVMWIEPKPQNHWYRIKVSNTPNKFDKFDNFSITIPDLKIIGSPNKKLISTETLNNLLNFVDKFGEAIIAFSENKIYKQDFVFIIDGIITLEDVLKNI
jgi:hypothetical protein